LKFTFSSQDGNYLVGIQGQLEQEFLKSDEPKYLPPNFTTKELWYGPGPGLCARRIVENAGAKFWFKTEEDSGSIFYVSSPKFTANPSLIFIFAMNNYGLFAGLSSYLFNQFYSHHLVSIVINSSETTYSSINCQSWFGRT
jgi:hypothetical protein